jgi:hypothetical protein
MTKECPNFSPSGGCGFVTPYDAFLKRRSLDPVILARATVDSTAFRRFPSPSVAFRRLAKRLLTGRSGNPNFSSNRLLPAFTAFLWGRGEESTRRDGIAICDFLRQVPLCVRAAKIGKGAGTAERPDGNF